MSPHEIVGKSLYQINSAPSNSKTVVMLKYIPLSMIHYNDKRKFCASDFKRCYRIESRLWIEKKTERLNENCAIIPIITASNNSALIISKFFKRFGDFFKQNFLVTSLSFINQSLTI